MIDGNTMLTVNLTAGELQVVMGALAEVPPVRLLVLEKLRQQIVKAEPDAFEVAAGAAPRVNGQDVVQE
jgi:hypothetical protein